jgi:hypothetical protein
MAEGLVSVLKQELAPYKLGQKLIAQSYDGAAVFSGGKNGVQVKMKDNFPHAHFIHCYAQQLNLVMKQACSTVKSIKLFFANISGFVLFPASPKRSDLLRTVCGCTVPKSAETQ